MKYLSFKAIKFYLAIFLSLYCLTLTAQSVSSLLENGFKNPPDEARPGTWWHWTNRLSGDRLAAPGKKVLNSNLLVWPGSLNESGLPGPVKISGEGSRVSK
jgi:hypothetical protein